MRRLCDISVTIAFAAALAAFLALFAISQARPASASAQGSSSEPYHQIVDDATAGRFEAAGWKEHSADAQAYGESYSYIEEESREASPARFKVRIPRTDYYSVYAYWPTGFENSVSARFSVPTTSGPRWTHVDQRTDGGLWVRVGAFKMNEGERVLQLSGGSSGSGHVVADAVMVVGDALVGHGGQTASVADPEELAEDHAASRSGSTFSAQSISNPTRRDIVRVSKRYLDVRYRYGVCTRDLMSCTCETKKTFRAFGHSLPMTEYGQWRYSGSRRVPKTDLRLGDILFFKESGLSGPITHVGVYSGHGNIVHASSYFGRVVESELRYMTGFWGAKRLTLR